MRSSGGEDETFHKNAFVGLKLPFGLDTMKGHTMAENRAILITGASTGIGEACALRLAGRGFTVYAGVRRTEDGERLQSQSQGVIVPVHLDVTDAESVAAAARQVGEALADGRLFGLINNPGIVVAGPPEFVPIDDLRRQLEINVIGQIAVTQAVLPMLRAAQGRIVNMGSIAGRMATPFVGAYGASKHAMEALSDALRFELAPWNIQVSLIEPGGVQTPIWKKSEASALAAMEAAGDRIAPLYGAQLAALQDGAAKVAKMAIPVSRVADVVEHALTARRPQTRYLVGFDARVQACVRAWLPDRWRDAAVRIAMKIPAKPGGKRG